MLDANYFYLIFFSSLIPHYECLTYFGGVRRGIKTSERCLPFTFILKFNDL